MITDEKELYKKFTERNDDYVHVDKSIEFIEACLKNKVAILGIDGLVINDEILPMMEYITDFSTIKYSSWEEFVIKSTELAKEFLKSVPHSSDLYFDIVIEIKKNKDSPS